MKSLIRKMRNSTRLKTILTYTNIVILGLFAVIALTLDTKRPFNYINILLVGAFCLITIFYSILYKVRLKYDMYVMGVFGLAGFIFISFLANIHNGLPKTPLLMLLMSFFIYLWLYDKRDKLDLHISVFLFATWSLLILFALFERRSMLHPSFSNRAGGSLGNENDVARHLVFCVLFNAYSFLKTKKIWLKIILVITTLVGLYELLLTGSISNLAITMLALFIGVIVIVPKKWKIIVPLAFVAIASIGVILILTVPMFSYFKTRLLGILSSFGIGQNMSDGSASERLMGAINGLKLFLDSPLFGNGYNGVYASYKIMAHNNFVEIIADYGLFAFAIEEILIIYPIISLRQVEKKHRFLIASLVGYMLLLQFFLVSFNSKIESIVLAFVYTAIEKESLQLISHSDYSEALSNLNIDPNHSKHRIIEIIPRFMPIGGAERFVSDFSLFIKNKREDEEVIIIHLFPDDGNPVIEELKKNGVPILFLNKNKGLDVYSFVDLRYLVDTLKPDIVHSHITSLTTILLSGIWKDHKIAHTFHSIVSKESYGRKIKPNNLMIRFMLKTKMIRPVAISNVVFDSISTYFHMKKERIELINNGVPLDKFVCDTKLSCRKTDFIFVGRFIDIKNPLLIIEAFEQSKIDGQLVMVGEGPLKQECSDYIDKNNLSNVSLFDFTNDVASYLKESKCLVLASNFEGNPIVINEAIACGCFLIASRVGGIPDVVNDANGLLIEKDNLVSNLKVAMIEFYSNLPKYEAIIKESYDNNCAKVSIENTVDSYIEMFRGLAE